MTPEQAIATLPDLVARLRGLTDAIDLQAGHIRSQWDQLGKIGGQRADHAAALLATLHTPLDHLIDFATNSWNQIDEMAKNPFGEEVQTPVPTGPNLA